MSSIQPKEFKLENGIKITLRTTLLKDASQIVKLMRDIVDEGPYTLVEPDEYRSTVRSEAHKIRKFKKAKGKIYLVAACKSEITGFISFDNWDTRRTSHTGLFSIFIKKKWRGKGVGKILVGGMLDWAKENPMIRKISLYVFSTNTNAIALYKKLGFRVEGKFLNDMIIEGKFVHSIAMFKWIK